MNRSAILTALGSAALFGASTPAAKLLLTGADPWLLAGLLYLGSGLGLGALILVRRLAGAARPAPLARADLPWLAGAVLAGGVVGPLLLLRGLAAVDASTASLLLNLEGLATMAIAWLVFREGVDRRLLLGAAAILAGAVLLSWQGGAGAAGPGVALIVGACLAWGIDNNLTRNVSGADAMTIAAIKGAVAGSVSTALALAAGASLPALGLAAMAGLVGLLGYGVSLVLFVRALRELGAARTGAYFSTAPFLGAAIAVVVLGEPVSAGLAAAAVLMALGVWLHVTERHDHLHAHEPMEHDHLHVHDAHHGHVHRPHDPSGEPHVHPHRHAPLVHRHPHYPDLHHRHGH